MKISAVSALPSLAHQGASPDQSPQFRASAAAAATPGAVGTTEIRRAVDQLNQQMAAARQDVRYHIHDKTHRLIIQIVDRQTNAVIEEVPPSKILDMVAAFTAQAVDKKV